MSLISVIIPVWNGENYLRASIESVLNQKKVYLELIVVNDGSSDGTAEILKGYGNQIISIEQTNQGLGAARNTGVRSARGDYIAFLDHDDLWCEDKLFNQWQAWLKHQGDPLVFTHLRQFYCPSLSQSEKQLLRIDESLTPGLIASTLFLSRGRYEQMGDFTEKKEVGEFVEWYARALRLSLPVCILPDLGVYRRVHQNNMGRNEGKNNRTAYLAVLRKHLHEKRVSAEKKGEAVC